MRKEIEKRPTRWFQQRWLMDTVMETIGVEWDQARLAYYAKVCSTDAPAIFRGAGAHMIKFSEVLREFCAAAGRMVAARES